MHILSVIAFILAVLILVIGGLASVLRDLLMRDFVESPVTGIDITHGPQRAEMAPRAAQPSKPIDRFADPHRIQGHR